MQLRCEAAREKADKKEKEKRDARDEPMEPRINKVLISRKGSGESRVVYCRCIGLVSVAVCLFDLLSFFLSFFNWLLEGARCTPSLFIILIHESREGVVLLVNLANELDCSS